MIYLWIIKWLFLFRKYFPRKYSKRIFRHTTLLVWTWLYKSVDYVPANIIIITIFIGLLFAQLLSVLKFRSSSNTTINAYANLIRRRALNFKIISRNFFFVFFIYFKFVYYILHTATFDGEASKFRFPIVAEQRIFG